MKTTIDAYTDYLMTQLLQIHNNPNKRFIDLMIDSNITWAELSSIVKILPSWIKGVKIELVLQHDSGYPSSSEWCLHFFW